MQLGLAECHSPSPLGAARAWRGSGRAGEGQFPDSDSPQRSGAGPRGIFHCSHQTPTTGSLQEQRWPGD